VYEGEFVNGKKHGKGVMKYPSGGYVSGEFRNDQLQGNGVF